MTLLDELLLNMHWSSGELNMPPFCGHFLLCTSGVRCSQGSVHVGVRYAPVRAGPEGSDAQEVEAGVSTNTSNCTCVQ